MRAPAGNLRDDPHNERLVQHVHPPDWKNPDPSERYNMVVIGGGTAGLVSAAGAAILGARVALVERALLGGDCLNTGCVPSKALIRAGRAAADVARSHRWGVRLPGEPQIDFPETMTNLRRLRSRIAEHDSARRFSDLGVDVYYGEARFLDESTIDVDGTRLRFRKAVIASGARAIVPPIEGLEETGYLTNESVFELTELPRRLLVVGGGPLGSELAQSFARLGSRVTMVEMLPRFLPNEDPDASALLAAALAEDGVRVRLGATVRRATRVPGGRRVLVESSGVLEEIDVDEILVGVGRAPNVDALDLEEAGVDFDRNRGVVVDDRLRTTNRNIFAAGDVALRHKFTHTADAAARIVLQNALFPGRKKLSALTVPWVTYTSPEIAHVGLYEHEARERGLEVETVKIDFEDVDRAILDEEENGFVKVHVQRGRDRILGATIVGAHAGEMIGEITLAMVARVGLRRLADVIHPYPTQAEAIRRIADEFRRRRFTPRLRSVLARWFAWTR